MQLRILSQGVALESETRRAVERQVRLVVGRFAAIVARVQITMGPSRDDPEHGAHRCRIRVDLGHGEILSFVADDPDPVAAAAGAAWRIQRRLRQRPDRARRQPTDALNTEDLKADG
ncbi:MAG: HPF/RaiA family ribosome-associated protein [Myxococcota bacterium]